MDGEVSCKALPSADPIPTADDFKDFFLVSANVIAYQSITNLEPTTEYKVYCYAKSIYGIPSQTSIEATATTITTYAEEDAPVIVIGNTAMDRTSGSVSIVASHPGKLWCIAALDSNSRTRLEVKENSEAVDLASYSETVYNFLNLKAGTAYYIFCTAESHEGVPMISDVNRIHKNVVTVEPKEAWYITALRLLVTAFLVLMSGLFSGLNLGLMGLDLISLRMISETNVEEIAGESVDAEELKMIQRQKECATKIYPIRQKGNLLLCTLLIGNVMVNTLISIITADMTSGTVGFIISTCLITAFGEVIPQAYGSRHGLEFGAKTTSIVKVIMAILYIICKPVSMVLDYALGDELGNVYNRYQLYTMFELYKEHSDFKKDTISTMQGALVMDTKTVNEYYHKLEDVYMLPDTTILDNNMCLEIFKKGYSRIPVYHDDLQNVVGILHVKELIMIDPNQSMGIEAILKLFPSTVLVIDSKRTVSDSIKDMVNSHTELAFVSKTVDHKGGDKTIDLVGIVTLEDMIRAVMRLDLVDETPVIESKEVTEAVQNVFGHVLLNHLDTTTTDIITYFINQSLTKQQLYLPNDVILNLIHKGSIEHITTNSPPVYEIGQPCDYAVVIMQGVFTVVIGQDRMMTEKPVFSVINLSALLSENYVYVFEVHCDV